MTPAEIGQLERLEKVIESGKQTFLAVGNALIQIQLLKLWRRDYETWEGYCHGRWGFSRQRTHQLIEATKAVSALPANVSTMVDNERTARALTKPEIPVDRRAEIVSRAAANGAVTGASIRREAAKILEAVTETEPPAIPVDTMGFPIPKVSLPYWERRHEIQDLMSAISKVRGALKCYQDNKDPWLCDLNNALSQHLTSAFLTISDRKPDVVCPYCEGKFSYTDEYGKHDCKACFKTGLMAKALFERVPPQFRERRAKALQ